MLTKRCRRHRSWSRTPLHLKRKLTKRYDVAPSAVHAAIALGLDYGRKQLE